MLGFLEYKHKRAMAELLYLDTLRGEDSTGLSVVKRDRGVITRKMTVPGYEFIKYPIVDKSMTHGDQLWLGHNRFKTTGDVSKANAHPFEVLDDEGDVLLIGAHNGTLNNKWDVEKLLHGQKFETDSEAMFNLFVEANDFKRAIGSLKGAWSSVWWDPTTDSVHFCRNKERPMCYAYSEDKKVFIFASEAWMIINACRRNGVDLEKNDKGFSCYATLPDNLYTMVIPQERDVPLPELVRIGGYSGASENFRNKFAAAGWNWWDEEREKKVAAREKETTPVGEKKQDVVLGYPPNDGEHKLRGYEGKPLTPAEYKAIKDKGCGWCGDEFTVNSALGFLSEDTAVCFNCMRDRHSKGDCVRPEGRLDGLAPVNDYGELDDNPFDDQEDTEEYRSLIAAAATGKS